MPKDDSNPLDAEGSNTKAPLRRGDACLYCRKRRIKCTAEKPSCQHCVKLKKECVYDTGKPTSRVKQLEEKVAQLEGLLTGGTGVASINNARDQPVRQQSTDQSQTGGSFNASGPLGTTEVVDFGQLAMGGSGLNSWGRDESSFGGFGEIGVGGVGSNGVGPSGMTMGPEVAKQMFDFSMLDPGFMDLVNTFAQTNTTSGNPAAQGMEIDAFSPTGLTPFLNTSPDPLPTTKYSNSSTHSSAPAPSSTSVKSTPPAEVPYQAFVTDLPPSMQTSSFNSPDYPAGGSSGQSLGIGGGRGVADDTGGSLVGGWFDPADLPRVARDHLLDLFFSGMRLFGQNFHVPRFFAALQLPPSKRPHPCLLYTMYVMASRISTSPPIRALEPHFATIAAQQLDEAIAKSDRLFDAVRASTIFAVYKFSLAKYHEGCMETARAARLAITCGLHVIPSSTFRTTSIPQDSRGDLVGLMRTRSWVLPPPRDAIELGERIWAFWAIFTVDRSGSISAQWPPTLPDDIVTTPYPRPLHEYELGLITGSDDDSLSTLYDDTPRPGLPYYMESTYFIIRARGMAIFERASKLIYLKPEPGWEILLSKQESTSPAPNGQGISPPSWAEGVWNHEQYNALFGGGNAEAKGKGKGWQRTAKIRTPKAYDEIRNALLRIEGDLPMERRTDWEVWDGITFQVFPTSGTQRRDAFTMHYVLGCSWMFLFDVYSFNAENEKAVNVARRMTASIRAMHGEPMGGDLDVFIAMTWSFIVNILIRESKRLQSIGDQAGSEVLGRDIDSIVQGLRAFGWGSNIANMQAARAERFRQTSLDEMKWLEADDIYDDHSMLPKTRVWARDGGSDGPRP